MSNFEKADFFTDASLCEDPYPFFDYLRTKGPVGFDRNYNTAVITGQNEALAVYNNAEDFSACNSVGGPLPPLPFVPEGDDISAQIEQHRDEMPACDLVLTKDRPVHSAVRSLLMRLFTPSRLRENEAYIRALAENLIDELLAKGHGEIVSELGTIYSTLVIADLLGIPEEDRPIFGNKLARLTAPIGGAEPDALTQHPLEFLHERFTAYVEDRRAAPRSDVLTDLATALFPDGSTPSVLDVVRVAANLFAAGQGTTADLLATTLRMVAERPELQAQLREKPELVANFIEEVLRLEGPIKSTFRLTRRTTRIGDVEVKAGTTVMTAIASVNRDPERYDRPDEVVLDRPKLREHLAFGRGVHTCPGAPLARVEVRVMLERLLARTSNISISDAHHGSEAARRYDYAPTYMIRGLTELHLDFTGR